MARRRGARSAAAILFGLLVTVLHVGAASGEIAVQIGTVEAAPGAIVALPVTLHTDGEPLSGFQNDLLFKLEITPLGRGEWRADCSQNPALLPGDLGAQFTLSDFDCAADTACIRTSAVLSTETFPSGSVVVYTCAVQVAHDAAPASYAVRCSNLGTSTQRGEPLPARCSDGAIVVAGEPVDVTPSIAPTPTPPVNGPHGTPILDIASSSGHPGDRLTVEFRLRTEGATIAGLAADTAFFPAARIAARPNGKPDCAFGADPNFAGYSGVAFLPPGCTGDSCTAMRAVLITTETVPIPDGTLLMSCAVQIAADAAPGVYPLSLSRLDASTPYGEPVPLAAKPGAVSVTDARPGDPPDELDTPPTPTATPALEPDANQGQQPISGSGVPGAASGCAICPASRSPGSWAFLVVAALLALRRHRRQRLRCASPGEPPRRV